MDSGNERAGADAGSASENTMKGDETEGGIEVFNGDDDNPHEIADKSTANNNTAIQVYKEMRPKQSLVGVSGKRKTWKSETSEGSDKSPIQIARKRSELAKNLDEQCKTLSVSADGIKKSPTQIARRKSDLIKNLDEQCKELSVSADGIKKSPIQTRKKRSEWNRELNVSVDGMEKSPNRSIRTRSISQKGSSEPSDGMQRNSTQLRKVKSESSKASRESSDRNESNCELRKVKSDADKGLDESVIGSGRKSFVLSKEKFESNELLDESRKVLDQSAEEIKKSPTGIVKSRSDENCKEICECEEKVFTSNVGNVTRVKSPPELEASQETDDEEDDWEEEELEEEVDEEIETKIQEKGIDVKEISKPEQKAKKIVIEEKKIHHYNVKPVPISTIVKRQPPPVVNLPRIVPKPTKTKPSEFHRVPKPHGKLQSLVDLVMWRDASKSAFIFGLGTFIIISSSYTTDLNISLISVVSYVALVYLAAIFFFRSILCRGAVDVDDHTSQEHAVGEEEAVWLLKLILPYVNEFLLKLRDLFSGDPATTMKLAVLLFVLARCGSSITIWKMAKLGFFGVFTVPKICSSYSSQLTACGTFWIRRFRDAWVSCSHKKAVGFFIFTVVWNLSSVVARIWAVFMLVVAFRYYQHSFMKEEEGWVEEDEEEEARGSSSVKQNSWERKIGGHRRNGRGPTLVELNKQKKGS